MGDQYRIPKSDLETDDTPFLRLPWSLPKTWGLGPDPSSPDSPLLALPYTILV